MLLLSTCLVPQCLYIECAADAYISIYGYSFTVTTLTLRKIRLKNRQVGIVLSIMHLLCFVPTMGFTPNLSKLINAPICNALSKKTTMYFDLSVTTTFIMSVDKRIIFQLKITKQSINIFLRIFFKFQALRFALSSNCESSDVPTYFPGLNLIK